MDKGNRVALRRWGSETTQKIAFSLPALQFVLPFCLSIVFLRSCLVNLFGSGLNKSIYNIAGFFSLFRSKSIGVWLSVNWR